MKDGVEYAKSMIRMGVESKTAMKTAANRTGQPYRQISAALGIRFRGDPAVRREGKA